MVPNVKVVFELDGTEKVLAYRKVPMNAWSELKQVHGFVPGTLVTAAGEWDQDAICAVVWLERKQRERRLGLAAVRRDLMDGDHDFQLVDFVVDGRSYAGDGTEPEDDEDPTEGS